MNMKKIILVFIIGIFILSGIILLNKNKLKQDKYKEFTRINYNLENKNLRLLVADTPEKWGQGLMFFRKLKGVDGMIFIFPDKQKRTFWNKNTFMDLDLYWIDDNKVVGKSSLPSIEKSKKIITVESLKRIDKVIELPTSNF